MNIERVAKAIALADDGVDLWEFKSETGDGCGYLGKVDYIKMAIASITELSLITEAEVKSLKDDECIIHENCYTCGGHVEGMQNILKAILNAK